MLETLQLVLNNILGFVLGLAFCYGLRAILRHFMKDEATADKITVLIVVSILIITIIWLFIFA